MRGVELPFTLSQVFVDINRSYGVISVNLSMAGLRVLGGDSVHPVQRLASFLSGDKGRRKNACYRKISSNGLVSRKQLFHTSLTTLIACSSSLHCGRMRTDNAALLLTQS
jgi:hypothetical protein